MNHNQTEGRKDEAKGKAKEVTGKVTGDKSLENRGKAQKIGGKTQSAFGDAKNDLKKDRK